MFFTLLIHSFIPLFIHSTFIENASYASSVAGTGDKEVTKLYYLTPVSYKAKQTRQVPLLG